jgi:teichuronic acid biosynthesis glycosyltransferase TuaC
VGTARAIRQLGWTVVVVVPTPWIPRLLAVTPRLRQVAQLPARAEIDGIAVYYIRCPFYPHRTVRRLLSNRLPFFESRWLWPWCRRSLRRTVTSVRPTIVHANFAFPSGSLAALIGREFGIPYVFQERSLQDALLTRRHPFYARTYRDIARRASGLVVNNQQAEKLIRELIGADVPSCRVTAAYDPLSVGEIPNPQRANDERIVLCVGSFTKRKGQELLLRAAAIAKDRLPDVKYRFIGSGVYFRECQVLADRLGLREAAEFLGQKPHREVLEAMARCTLFALPSWQEAFGSVYCEAMAFGKPVIACRDGGLAAIAQHGVHAWFVRPKDSAALADALTTLLSDCELARRIGDAGRQLAQESFTYNHVAKEIDELYRLIMVRQVMAGRVGGEPVYSR